MTKHIHYEQPGPDKGFAWIVALSCFFINFIMAGLARSAGVLYVALIELYGVSREAATTPFSIRVCVRNMTGPIVGMLGQRYGIRVITISGGVFAAVGGILCYFAPDVFWITIFWGGIHGIGFGLSTVLHMIAVNQYFDKYRATAMGICYSGNCIGSFILPIILDSLLLNVGLKGTFLVISAIVLNVIPLAMLLKPPPWLSNSAAKSAARNKFQPNQDKFHENKAFTGSQVVLNETLSSDVINDSNDDSHFTNKEIPSYQEAVRFAPILYEKQIHSNANDSTPINAFTIVPELTIDVNACDTYNTNSESNSTVSEKIKQNNSVKKQTNYEKIPQTSSNHLPVNDKNTAADNETTISKNGSVCMYEIGNAITETVTEGGNLKQNDFVKTIVAEHHENNNDTLLMNRTSSENKRLGVEQDEKGGSLSYKNNCSPATKPTSTRVGQEIKFRTGDEITKNTIWCGTNISYNNNKFKRNTAEIGVIASASESSNSSKIDENNMSVVLRNTIKANVKPMFILISFTAAVYFYLWVSVITVIIDYGVDKGTPQEQGKYFIIGFSATDLVGRLGFGMIIDRKWIPLKRFSALTVGITGFFVTLIPLCSGFSTILIAMCSVGFVQSGVAIMFPLLLNEYMEKHEESIAMGCVSFYAGILMLSMAPMIGFFRDKYGSYDNMFRLVGVACSAVGLIWFLEPMILKCQSHRKVTKIDIKSAIRKQESSVDSEVLRTN